MPIVCLCGLAFALANYEELSELNHSEKKTKDERQQKKHFVCDEQQIKFATYLSKLWPKLKTDLQVRWKTVVRLK